MMYNNHIPHYEATKKNGTVQNFYVTVAITWKNYLVKKMIIKINKSEKKNSKWLKCKRVIDNCNNT